MNNRFQGNFAYAKQNGYTGTYEQYLQFNYEGYCATCKRCDVEPKPFYQWLNSGE